MRSSILGAASAFSSSVLGVVSIRPEAYQLTSDDIGDFSDITFGNANDAIASRAVDDCRYFPGDQGWPSDSEWSRLNSSIDGALLKPEPAAAVCYPGPAYDEERCRYLVETASSERYFWLDDPLTALAEWTQGATCTATLEPQGNCTRGGFPAYVVNATSVKHVQATVNFARNRNIRVIIKNTGHDFGGRSVGAGSLSIWVHHFKDFELLPEYTQGSYTGRAVRYGAGVEAWEMYNFMAANNITLVAPGGSTVGGVGGWMSVAGHSSITSMYGLGADQALSLEVVTTDGRVVTADPETNTDLFWALRGGGGATYGIITSVIMKAYDPINLTTSALDLDYPSTTVPDVDTFWQAVGLYYRYCAEILDAGGYGFSYVYPGANGSYRFTTTSQFPAKTTTEVRSLLQPLYDSLNNLLASGNNNNTNVSIANPDPSTRPYGTPRGGGDGGDRPINTRYRSRLLPRANWEDDTLFEQTMGAIRRATEAGFDNDFYFHGTLTSPTEEVAGWPGRDNAVLPAWRQNRMHAMLMDLQPPNLTGSRARDRDAAMQAYVQLLRDVSPGAGSYLNEGDPGEPAWQQAFFGDHYARLLQVKRARDPWHLLWAPTTVGSEGWAVRPVDGYPNSQNGRLCRTNATAGALDV